MRCRLGDRHGSHGGQEKAAGDGNGKRPVAQEGGRGSGGEEEGSRTWPAAAVMPCEVRGVELVKEGGVGVGVVLRGETLLGDTVVGVEGGEVGEVGGGGVGLLVLQQRPEVGLEGGESSENVGGSARGKEGGWV